MQVNRILEVQDSETLPTLRSFLADWWRQYELDAMLAPVEQPEKARVISQVIEDPADLERVNPFAPLMFSNAAGEAYRLRQERQGARLAAILHPCEMRAYTELCKRERPKPTIESGLPAQGELVIFGVDCLGTLPTGDYQRKDPPGDLEEMTREALHDATWGGSHADQYRMACQVCDWPAPWGADVTIGTIGVDSDQTLLLLARDEDCDARLGWENLLPRRASEYQVSRREAVVGAIASSRADRRNHLLSDAAGHFHLDDLGAMLAWLASCSVCGNCLKVCPLYQGEMDSLAGVSHLSNSEHTALGELVHTSRWLASCSGCGMCEEKCNRNVPLTLFLSALSHRIREEIHYTPGSPGQRFPWIGG